MNDYYVQSAAGELKQVLLCPPTYLNLNPINKIAEDWLDQGQVIDQEKSLLEHNELISIYEQNDIKVEILEATDKLDSQVFSRDFGFNLKEGYVLGRFKENLRKDETQKYAAKLAEKVFHLLLSVQKGNWKAAIFGS